MSVYQVEEALAVLRRRLQPEVWHPDPLAIAGLPIGLKLDFSWAEYLSGAGGRLKRSYSVDALRSGEAGGGTRAARGGVERQQSESGEYEYDLVISGAGAPRRGPHFHEELGARFARGGEQCVSSFVRVVRRSSFNTPPLSRAAIGKASVKRAGSQPTSTRAEVAARYSNLRRGPPDGGDQMNVEHECTISTPWMPIGRVSKRSCVSHFQAISEASVAPLPPPPPPPPPQSPSPSTRSAAAAVEERTRAHQMSARAASVPLDSDRRDSSGGGERKRPRIVFEEGAPLHAFAESDPYENVLVFPGALLTARRGRPERPDPSGLPYIDSGASSATSDSARATPSPAPAPVQPEPAEVPEPEPEPESKETDIDALHQEEEEDEEEEKKNGEAEQESSSERDSSTLSPEGSPAHWPPGSRRQGPGPGAGPGAGASAGRGGQQDQGPAAGGSRQGHQSGSSSAPRRQQEQQSNSTRLTGVTPLPPSLSATSVLYKVQCCLLAGLLRHNH